MENAFLLKKYLNDNIYNTPMPEKINEEVNKKVYLCIGSDKIIFDCLGPIVGSVLQREISFNGFVYGTLSCPVTALQVETAIDFIRRFHYGSNVVVIDSAVGKKDEIGKIKFFNRGLRPALGIDKNMRVVGDKSIMGIVTTKENVKDTYNCNVKLKDVYEMAEKIAKSIINGREEIDFENKTENCFEEVKLSNVPIV